jgi:hypothetical protein
VTFYTYIHTRASDNKPFYVGKGRGKRAYSAAGRNTHWHRVVAKHGLKVDIASRWPTEVEAFEHEKFLILCLKDMKMLLVNQTNGGEGRAGWVPDELFRNMVSRVHAGKAISDETKAKMSASGLLANAAIEVRARKRASWTPERRALNAARGRELIHHAIQANVGAPSHMLGKKQSEEAKAKISAAVSGENNPMFGKTFSHTDEAKAKIAKASKNRIITDKARASISASAKAAWARRKAAQINRA